MAILALLLSSGGQGRAQSATSTNSVTDISGLMPPPPPPLVLTNPAPGPVAQFPSFSAAPTVAEIKKARVFEEPLIPVGGVPSQAENNALANALIVFASRTQGDDFSALENYLQTGPNTHWYSSVLYHLGREYFITGLYSKALDAWEEAWYRLQDETGGEAKQLADKCLGELTELHAHIGNAQRLQELFSQIGDRPVTQSGGELVSSARQALWLMQRHPEITYRCGPLALRNISKLVPSPADVDELVADSASTTNGISLSQLHQLSQQLQLSYQPAKRQPGSPLPLPCVVNWKIGHYAAILKQDGDRYFVADPTFGASRWISAQALNNEASGYFLVPPGTLTNGWQAVGATEASTIWGKGLTGSSDPNNTTPYDEMADPSCRLPGMASYNIHLLLASLHIEDTPLSFTPPRGPTINFTVTYNQREANQPVVFNYSNLGHKWTCNWISYLTDNGTNTAGDVLYYVPGGGTEVYTYNSTNANYDRNWRNLASLVRLSSSSYQLSFPDGSIRIFSQPNGVVGNSRKIFLTQVISPTGYTNLLNYDSDLRLVSVTDPQAAATNLTFYYAVSGGMSPVDIYKIQQVTDRYGRSATFSYGSGAELQSVTDPVNITSQFNYADNSDFINALTTPYGTTTFAYGDNGGVRWLEATDPQGGKSRVEYNQSEDLGVPSSDPGTLVPKGVYTRNYILFGRNTFYWDKKAMAEAPGDYTKARIYHWLHNSDLAAAEGCLESTKEPLENRVWFNYPGQGVSSAGATIYGAQMQPSAVARVADDGSSYVYYFNRNALGKITNSIDPVGINFSYDYATNQIDLLRIRQTSAGSNELVASYTYNSQHLPLQAVDAAGQTNAYGYNTFGQIMAFTNALLQVTTFQYDSAGRLLSIIGPTNTAVTAFGYDAFDRVSSVTNPDSYYVRIAYDNLNRPVTNTYPDGTTETISYRYLDPQTYVDRAGRVTQFTYDSLQHLTQISRATNWNAYLGWCTCGSLSSLTDPLGQTTTWTYDLQGRVKSKRYADGSSVQWTYENTSSRVKTFTNERNQTRTNYYYPNGWLNEVVYANQAVTPRVAYFYDYYGRLTAMYDGYGDAYGTNYTFTYYPITSPPTLGAGRLKKIIDPDGLDTTTYTYDALGRTKSVTVTNTFFSNTTAVGFTGYGHTYTYDVLGRVSQDATPLVGTFTFNYAGVSSRLTSIGYPSSLTTTFGYYGITGDFQLLGMTNLFGSTVLSRFNYAYNKAGQITNQVRQLSSGLLVTNGIAYDGIGEVLSVLTNGSNGYKYAYDLAGNRTLEQQGTNLWRAQYNPLNELLGRDRGLASTNVNYQWDEEDRLVSVTENGVTAKMIYNGFGRLAYLREFTGGQISMYHGYVWDGNRVAQESYVNTNQLAYFHWYYDYGHYDSSSPTYYYTTRDALGSPREYFSVPAGGQIMKEYDYDPFGRQTTVIDGFVYGGAHFYYTTPPENGFTGLLGMPGHNLYFAANRVYDPDSARWLSRDPLGEAGGVNLYGYCGNDPINQIDPSGLCPQENGGGGRPPKTPLVTSAASPEDFGEENIGNENSAERETAEKLVTWVDEGGNLRVGGNPGMRPDAYNFQSGVSGARSGVLTGRSLAPYLSYTDESGNVVGAKFDGVRGSELIDRKLNPFFSAKAVNEAIRQAAVAQHYGLQAVWELPTQAAVNAANRFMQNNNINGIKVRLAQ